MQSYRIVGAKTKYRSRSTQRFQGPTNLGFRKVRDLCSYVAAQRRGVNWVWIDTCCIDKTSSAELSEAINSMYRYYQGATICIAHLADVDAGPCPIHYGDLMMFDCDECNSLEEQIKKATWFLRGWTLQELLAPRYVGFVNSNWNIIGYKNHDSTQYFVRLLQQITQIDVNVLADPWKIEDYSIAQRLSWAAKRTTTRSEDSAYCLFGIFGLNLPLLYGEGDRAWRRLLAALVETTSDETIFAAEEPDADIYGYGDISLLPISARPYGSCGEVRRTFYQVRRPYRITNQGLEMQLESASALEVVPETHPLEKYLAIRLNCDGGRQFRPYFLLLCELQCGHFGRVASVDLEEIGSGRHQHWRECKYAQTIYIHLKGGCDSTPAGVDVAVLRLEKVDDLSTAFQTWQSFLALPMKRC